MIQTIRKAKTIVLATLFITAGLMAAGSALVEAMTLVFSRFGTAQFGTSVFGGTLVAGQTSAIPVSFAQTWALSIMAVALIITAYALNHHRQESSS